MKEKIKQNFMTYTSMISFFASDTDQSLYYSCSSSSSQTSVYSFESVTNNDSNSESNSIISKQVLSHNLWQEKVGRNRSKKKYKKNVLFLMMQDLVQNLRLVM